MGPTAQDQEEWQAQKVIDLKAEAETHRLRRSSASKASVSEPVNAAVPEDETEEHLRRRSASSAAKPGPKSQRARKAASAAKKGGAR